MNRYIITREQFRGQEYFISALYDEKRHMIEVVPDAVGTQSILGNIYIARVENVVKNLNAAFVKISPTQTCYLSLDDVKHPVFTKKLSAKKALVAGEELLVQVSREALKTKEPSVTTNLSISGQYAVVTTGNRRCSVSAKLPGDVRNRYKELMYAQNYESYGVIVRTNAAETSEENLLADIACLQEQMDALIKNAEHRSCYTCLYKESAEWLRHVKDLRLNELEMILTDDRAVFEELCSYYCIPEEALRTDGSVPAPVDELVTKEGVRLSFYRDEMVRLSALYGVKSGLEEALQTRVWLKSGAYLVIEHTEAMTVIDVNSGKNVAKKDMQENFLRINREAACEIARQLRLRNISGMILIDFINLTSKEAESDLMQLFRAELRKDPVPTQLVDITKLGLAEVTRKKMKRSLRENLKSL